MLLNLFVVSVVQALLWCKILYPFSWLIFSWWWVKKEQFYLTKSTFDLYNPNFITFCLDFKLKLKNIVSSRTTIISLLSSLFSNHFFNFFEEIGFTNLFFFQSLHHTNHKYSDSFIIILVLLYHCNSPIQILSFFVVFSALAAASSDHGALLIRSGSKTQSTMTKFWLLHL